MLRSFLFYLYASDPHDDASTEISLPYLKENLREFESERIYYKTLKKEGIKYDC